MADRTAALAAHAAIPVGLLAGVVPVLLAPVVALLAIEAYGSRLAKTHGREMVWHLVRSLVVLAAMGAVVLLAGPQLPAVAALSLMIGLAAALYLLVAVPAFAVITVARGGSWRYPMSARELPAPQPADALSP